MKFARKHVVRASGVIDVTCIFHDEKTPSLRIWKDGKFWCHGCQMGGHVADYPELQRLFHQVHPKPDEAAQLEAAGQLRFPGF